MLFFKEGKRKIYFGSLQVCLMKMSRVPLLAQHHSPCVTLCLVHPSVQTMFVPATRSRVSYSRDALGAYTPGNHWKGGILESLWAAIQLTVIYVLNIRTNLWSCQDTRCHNESFILSHVLVLGSTVSEWTLTRK